MFNVVKIISSGSNVPDCQRMLTNASENYKVGSALILSAGRLVNATATSKPQYIAAESAEAGTRQTLVCYPVTPNMIFEVPVSGVPASVKAGTKITLSVNGGFADKVGTSTTDGVATVVDTRGAMKNGDKILVKFD